VTLDASAAFGMEGLKVLQMKVVEGDPAQAVASLAAGEGRPVVREYEKVEVGSR